MAKTLSVQKKEEPASSKPLWKNSGATKQYRKAVHHKILPANRNKK